MARILFVNDEPDLVEVSVALLSDEGHEVIGLTDGRQALRTAVERKPDLLILDWILDGLTAEEVVRQLRSEPATARLPILLITALADASERARLLALDGCLKKPFSADALRDSVNRLLRSKSSAP